MSGWKRFVIHHRLFAHMADGDLVPGSPSPNFTVSFRVRVE